MSDDDKNKKSVIEMDEDCDISKLNFDGVWKHMFGEEAEKHKKEYNDDWMAAVSTYTMGKMAKTMGKWLKSLSENCEEKTYPYLFAVTMQGLIQSVAENYYMVLRINPHLLVSPIDGEMKSIPEHYSFINLNTMKSIEERHKLMEKNKKDSDKENDVH